MKIRELFESDVTRDIPPVVYFHETSPEKLAAEVQEYIITGGWPEAHPNHRRVPRGIHEEYVHLLDAIATELDRKGGPELPTAWISGFYGSGKSSFAKLLGLALDGRALPDGRSLAEAWLARDTSPHSQRLKDAWQRLRAKVNPIAVVFDIGAVARDNEHLHAAIVRQVQRRLGYCNTDPIVADFELRLERDGIYKTKFEPTAAKVLGEPWSRVKDKALAEEDFSAVMHALQPDRYPDPMAWISSRAGTHQGVGSPDDAVHAIRDMLAFREPGAHLFVVVDEVSQYVLGSKDRVDRLRAFATALGATLKGKAWFLALGQQKLDEQADDSFLVWAKDRFPQKLRVHLAATNIRDVVHKRLLAKKHAHDALLRERFKTYRNDMRLFAYQGEMGVEDFVEVYPLLPGHVDLLLKVTTALRTQSGRAQGDDQAIRGLLQLLGELFRDQKLADEEVGALVSFDRIYEVQHTALDSDAQASMARILAQCAGDQTGLLVQVAKAVALLALVQESLPTDAKLVAQVLWDRLDRGSNVQAVTDALEELRRKNLLGYSEKHGYKLQSSAGEEWEAERRDVGAPREAKSKVVQDALELLLATPDRPKLEGRPFSWEGFFSDGRKADDTILVESRDEATVRLDFRLLARDDRDDKAWSKRSDEEALRLRIVWVAGDSDDLDARAAELLKSRGMVERYKPRRESMSAARKVLLQQEENRCEELDQAVKGAVAATWLGGRVYFRGEARPAKDFGATFLQALAGAATKYLPLLYDKFVATVVAPEELLQLVQRELPAPSPKFVKELGILELDTGRYEPTCAGPVPKRVLDHVTDEDGVSGTDLLAKFGGPPFGYAPNVVKACVAGLLRAGRVKIAPESGDEVTAVRDAGVEDVFVKDRVFKRATIFPAGDDEVGYQARARICKFFAEHLDRKMDREDHHIADAVQDLFPDLAQRTRAVLERHGRLPDRRQPPPELVKLQEALEACLRNVRRTQPTARQVKTQLDVLRDGVQVLGILGAELTDAMLARVQKLANVRDHEAVQLAEAGALDDDTARAVAALREQLGQRYPWREIAEAERLAEAVRKAYVAERTRLLGRQEEAAQRAQGRVKVQPGFSTLAAEQSHHVLRPIAETRTDTAADAIAPPLSRLKDGFDASIDRAEQQAIARLDELRSQKTLIVRVDLGLKNREIATAAELEALLVEVRERLVNQLDEKKGVRIRLL